MGIYTANSRFSRSGLSRRHRPISGTGADIGFRVDQMKDNRALVTLMVRSKSGEWVEAELSPHNGGLVPLESR